MSAVARDHVVEIHYTLKDDDGEVVDSSVGGEPLDYLHGHGGIVPGLEKAMEGRKVGDKFQVMVPPAEGYGDIEGEPKAVPRSAFPDDVELEEGMQFFVSGRDGDPVPVWVVAIKGDEVLLDQNHPLAGENLHFEIEVMGIRKASAEELEHGHPHGPDGHHHH